MILQFFAKKNSLIMNSTHALCPFMFMLEMTSSLVLNCALSCVQVAVTARGLWPDT